MNKKYVVEDKYIKIAEEAGTSYAEKLYADFIKHPEDLGKNFSWDRFHTLCGRIAAVSLYMCFSDIEWGKLQTHKLENICRKAAERRSNDIISASSKGELQWQKKKQKL